MAAGGTGLQLAVGGCYGGFKKGGDDALVQYWYGMILTNLSGVNKQESTCLIEHLIEYYRSQLVMVPSKERYIKKMLYMLNSLREPTDIEKLR